MYRSSSEKSLQGLEKGMRMEMYSKLTNNPELIKLSENRVSTKMWNDPRIQHNYIRPMTSRMGETFARERFENNLKNTFRDFRSRYSNI